MARPNHPPQVPGESCAHMRARLGAGDIREDDRLNFATKNTTVSGLHAPDRDAVRLLHHPLAAATTSYLAI